MYDGSKVINGTFSTVWLDDDIVAEATALQAKVDIKKDDIPILGRLAAGHKVTSWEGKGTLKVNHVTSRFAIKQADNLKKGIPTVCTIMSKLADPAAYGAERVAVKYVMFDDLTLIDEEVKKTGEISVPFTFEDFEFLDTIDPALIS
jgi:hypothetical protein